MAGEAGGDVARQARPLEHHRRIKLQQRGAGFELGARRLRPIDATRADQRKLALDPQINPRQHTRGKIEQGPAREPAGLPRRGLVAQAVGPRDRGVRHDQAVDFPRARHPDDVVDLDLAEVGRDLHQQRLAAMCLGDPVARVDHAGEEIVERLGLLQIAQAGRVGRGDVGGEIAGDLGEGFDAFHVIAGAVG